MRVLLAEDDSMIGASVRTGLRQDGFNVDWVRDGLAAETALGSAPIEAGYDVLLLDLGLPGKQGLDVLSTMRARGDPTPVLIVTARDAVRDRVTGLDSGADDYIVKPFDLNELAARIRAVVRRRTGRAAPLIEYAGLTLDPAAREACLDGALLSLSAREFDLLLVLVERPGIVYSRSQLEEKLYGWGEEVASNTIEVYIHGLRKKLGSRFVKNLRGVGYMVPRIAPKLAADA